MANTLFNQNSTNIKVNIGSSGGVVGSTLSSNSVTLSNRAVRKKKLTEMEDVNDATEIDGGTLVYDADNDEYVLKALNVDGGTF